MFIGHEAQAQSLGAVKIPIKENIAFGTRQAGTSKWILFSLRPLKHLVTHMSCIYSTMRPQRNLSIESNVIRKWARNAGRDQIVGVLEEHIFGGQ